MDGVSCQGTYTEYGLEGVSAGTQVGNGTQVFEAVTLLLQRIVGSRGSLYCDLHCLQLKGLLHFGSQNDNALDHNGRTYVQLCDLVIVGDLLALKDYLKGLKAASVIQVDKAECFAIANTSRLAANGNFFSVKGVLIGINTFDQISFHDKPLFEWLLI